MRTYVVQQGDSPAKIAILFAGCPKCAADLVDANPQKRSFAYQNGFRTFRSLAVGERLFLPDMWFNGALDGKPQSYFDALPGVDGRLGKPAPPPPIPVITPPGQVGVPAAGVIPPPPGPFVPGEAYTLTVWPINTQAGAPSPPIQPSGAIPFPKPVQVDPSAVLSSLNFNVQSAVPIGDGSYTVEATYVGTAPYNASPTAGQRFFVFDNSSAQNAHNQICAPAGPCGPAANAQPAYQPGETVRGDQSGTTAQVAGEMDIPGGQEGVLTLANPTGWFQPGEVVRGLTSNGGSDVKYQYRWVLTSPAGAIGITSRSDQGSALKLPYTLQQGDQVQLVVQPQMDATGMMSDPTVVLQNLGIGGMSAGLQNSDCSWPITGIYGTSSKYVNASGVTLAIHTRTTDPTTGQSVLVKALTVNGLEIKPLDTTPLSPIPAEMRACHSFSMQVVYGGAGCAPIQGGQGVGDPSNALAKIGLTNFAVTYPGPDQQGQWTIQGIWEGPDGFTLQSHHGVTITGYTDNGQGQNVPSGPCATSLPFTVQPGDLVHLIVQPISAGAGLPMTDPTVLLTAAGFQVNPGIPYSDCSWQIVGTYQGPGSLQISDPMLNQGGGAWIKALAVNGTVIKPLDTTPLVPQSPVLTACTRYTIRFTVSPCAPVGGNPGSWDPTPALNALGLTGFVLAPGPNEAGEYSVTGTWKGGDGTQLPATSGGITITGIVDYGLDGTCTPTCPAGQVNDSVTGACVSPCADGTTPASGVCPPAGKCIAPQLPDQTTGACVSPCSDGSAPNAGVCPPPVKATGPVTPPAASSSSTGTVVAVAGGAAAAVVLGLILIE